MSRRIVIEFLGKDTSLGKTADHVGDKTSKLGSRMKKVGLVAGAGFAAGALVAGKALVGMGKNAAADEAGMRRLALSLKNSTGATDAQVDGVERWISAQGKALGVTDDELRPALQRFVQVTGDVGKAQKLTSLAMDVSAGSGKSLTTVSGALARAQNGNMTGLARLGIATKNAKGETLSLDQVMKNAASTHKGQATAAAGSLEGKMGRLRLMFDETKETIGSKLIPVVTKLADWFLNTGIPAIAAFSSMLSTTLGPVFERVRAIISGAMGGMHGDVSKNLTAIKSTFASVISIVTSLWNAFGGTIVAYARSSLNNLRTIIGGGLKVISGIFKVFASLLKGDWRGVWVGIKLILSGAWQVIKGLVAQGWNTIKAVFRAGGTALKAIFRGIWSGMKQLAAAGAGQILSAIRGIPGRIRAYAGMWKSAGAFLIHGFVAGMRNAAGIISGIAGNVWSGVKRLLNGAIGRINRALNFSISLPGPDLHINAGRIPYLAKGGVVKASRGGTLALLGEGGHDEMVTPLTGPHAPQGASQTVVVKLYLDSREIRTSLVKLKRTTGAPLGLA